MRPSEREFAMINVSKRAVTIAAAVASVFGLSTLGGAARAQIAIPGDCVQSPGGALCARAEVPNGAVYLPGAVVYDAQVIGHDPDSNVQLRLLKDPEPMNRD